VNESSQHTSLSIHHADQHSFRLQAHLVKRV
jgi:hypothetical protein